MSKNGIYAVGGIILLATIFALIYYLSGGQAPLSIIPSGIGGIYQAVPGATETWTTALDSITGTDLMAALGCSYTSQKPVVVTYQSDFKCMNSAGQLVYQGVNSGSQPTTIQCNYFQGQSSSWSANLIGQSSAIVPLNTPIGATSCLIHVEYTATGNGKTASVQDRSVPNGNRYVAVVSPPTPTCTSGSTVCSGSNVLTCSNNVYSFSQGCPIGCSNGACISECSPNSIQCIGNANFKKCGANGIWGSVTAINGGTCSNGQIIPDSPPTPVYKTCPTGEVILATATCLPYCGDGTCNSGENSVSCVADCPIVPVPPSNNTTQVCPTLYAPCPSGQHIISLGSDNKGCTIWGCANDSIIPPPIPDADNTILYVLGGIFVVLLLAIGYYAIKKE